MKKILNKILNILSSAFITLGLLVITFILMALKFYDAASIVFFIGCGHILFMVLLISINWIKKQWKL